MRQLREDVAAEEPPSEAAEAEAAAVAYLPPAEPHAGQFEELKNEEIDYQEHLSQMRRLQQVVSLAAPKLGGVTDATELQGALPPKRMTPSLPLSVWLYPLFTCLPTCLWLNLFA